RDPSTVPAHWRDWFEHLQSGAPEKVVSGPSSRSQPSAAWLSKPPVTSKEIDGELTAEAAEKQIAVFQLINAYRFRGHQKANIDPLHLYKRPSVPDLDPLFHGLTEEDLNTVFSTGVFAGFDRAPLRDVIALIEKIYCDTIGAEYMHITETAEKRWIQDRLEGVGAHLKLS